MASEQEPRSDLEDAVGMPFPPPPRVNYALGTLISRYIEDELLKSFTPEMAAAMDIAPAPGEVNGIVLLPEQAAGLMASLAAAGLAPPNEADTPHVVTG